MTSLDEALATTSPEPGTAVSTVTPRKCRRHDWRTVWRMGRDIGTHAERYYHVHGDAPCAAADCYESVQCHRCYAFRDDARTRRGKNNRKRGNAEELTVARLVGGRKVGPMGWPWDVEMEGYARIQVRKLATPQGLRAIADELARIAAAPGEAMPGYVWVEPGRGGERLIVFRLRDFRDRHGIPVTAEERGE